MIETSSSLAIAFFAAAMLYSSVGHGGGIGVFGGDGTGRVRA